MRLRYPDVIGILILFALVMTGCDNNTIQQTPIPVAPTPSATPAAVRQDVYGKATMEITAPYPVAGLTFSPDGQTLVTGSDDGKTVLWRVSDGQELRIISGLVMENGEKERISMAFSPDGQILVAEAVDTKIRLWRFDK